MSSNKIPIEQGAGLRWPSREIAFIGGPANGEKLKLRDSDEYCVWENESEAEVHLKTVYKRHRATFGSVGYVEVMVVTPLSSYYREEVVQKYFVELLGGVVLR